MSEQQEEKQTKPPEEMTQMRKNLENYYKEQNAVLTAQKEYECLLADIEDARQRRVLSTMRIAQMLAPEPPAENEPEGEMPEEPTPVKRTLKKEPNNG